MMTGEELRKKFPQAHAMILNLVLTALARDGRAVDSLSKEDMARYFQEASKHFMETVSFVKQAMKR